MFTGIVETVGRVRSIEKGDRIHSIRIEVDPEFLTDVKAGDSIAVDGACLTPVALEADAFVIEAIGTTLGRTRITHYREGSGVNLERALRLGGRLDGHLVQGHVDGLGELIQIRVDGESHRLEFRIPESVHRLTLLHGSITLNGVSLTVNALHEPDRVEVGIIPHTWSHTTMGSLAIGDPVNVEGDLIGKYVGRVLRRVGVVDPDSSPE